jgi:hypothetical protein
VILASTHGEDQASLDQALLGTTWSVAPAGDLPVVRRGLLGARLPIVLYDRDLPGPHWQEAFEDLSSARRPAALILLSNVSDPYLWEEVVQHGGFDVLTRPFRREEVLSLLLFARTHCSAVWPKGPSGPG